MTPENFGSRYHVCWAPQVYQVQLFESAERFFEEHDRETPGCMLLDICMPGMSGLDVQRSLVDSARGRPIVFLAGRGDIQTSAYAMKGGAYAR